MPNFGLHLSLQIEYNIFVIVTAEARSSQNVEANNILQSRGWGQYVETENWKQYYEA